MNSSYKTKLFFFLLSLSILFSYFCCQINFGQVNYDSKLIFQIKYDYFGCDSQTIQNIITKPLEEQLFQLENISEIKSVCQMNNSTTVITFNNSANYDSTYCKIREVTDQLSAQLPKDVQHAQINSTGFNDSSILAIAFDATKSQLENFKSQFESISGVGEVLISGQENSSIEIEFDNSKLLHHGITIDYVVKTIQDINGQDCFISIQNEFSNNRLNIKKFLTSIEKLSSLQLQTKRGFISLKEIASITNKQNSPTELILLNNKFSTILSIKATSNANWILISNECKSLLNLNELAKFNPIVIYDKGQIEKNSFLKILLNLLIISIVIMILILIYFKNIKIFFLCFLEIILTLLWTVGTLSFFNITITTEILSGISLSIGIIIDIPIYIICSKSFCTENYEKNNSQFKTIKKNIFLSQGTTLIVIISLLSLKNELPELFPISLSLFLMIIYMTILSIYFLPYFLPKFSFDISILNFVKKTFYIFSDKVFKLKIKFIHLILLSFILFPALIIFIPKSIEYSSPSNILLAYIDYNPEKSINSIHSEISNFLNSIQNIKHVRFVKTSITRGHSEIELVTTESKIDYALNSLKSKTELITNGSVYIPELNKTEKIVFQFAITGSDIQKCQLLAKELANKLKSEKDINQIILNFKNNEKQSHFNPNLIKLVKGKNSVSNFATTLRFNQFAPVITKVLFNNKEKDVRLKSNESNFYSTTVSKIPALNGNRSSLKELGTFNTIFTPSKINRLNSTCAAYISLEMKKNSTAIFNKIQEHFNSIPHDNEYTLKIPKHYLEKKENNVKLGLTLATCFIILFLFIAAFTEKIRLSIFIILSIPITISFTLFFHYILNFSLDAGTFVGMIFLSGMAVNNFIILEFRDVKKIFYLNFKRNNLNKIRYENKQNAKSSISSNIINKKNESILNTIISSTTTTVLSSLLINIWDKTVFTRNMTIFLCIGSVISGLLGIYLLMVSTKHEE